MTTGILGGDDVHYQQLMLEAQRVLEDEPELGPLLHRTVLAPGVDSFDDAVAATVSHRLLLQHEVSCPKQEPSSHGDLQYPKNSCRELIRQTIDSALLEQGHSMRDAIRADAQAVVDRDPAMDTLLEVVLFSKGYAALVCHRAAHRMWMNPGQSKKFSALFLQSQASAIFGVDLHPLARIGASVLLDHGTGIVVGETATIGDGCTILHGVTLGGTGKDHGDRHPKVGQHVLIGANSSILGNIHIGDSAKIGAGSVVLRSIPAFATAVGAPAKIIGRAQEADPASEVDLELRHVSLLHRAKASSSTFATLPSSSDEGDNDGSDPEREPEATEDVMPAEDSIGNANQHKDVQTESAGAESKHRKIIKVDCSGLCPFREYRVLAKSAPRGSVTLLTLTAMLQPLGCNGCEIGSIMFELDTNRVGYRIWDEAFETEARRVIQRNTSLDPETIGKALEYYRTVHEKARYAEARTPNWTTPQKPFLSAPRLRSISTWFRPHRTTSYQ